MRVITFDVEHGSSHIIRTPKDQVILFDAGSKEDFSPALYLKNVWGISSVRWFTLTHHDADHLTDISNIAEHLFVWALHTPDLGDEHLEQLYSEEFSTPLEVFMEYKKNFTIPVPPMHDPSYDWGGMQFATFANDFSDFENPNINNLSVVTFAKYMGWTFVFPGDLEKAGWQKLLEKPVFQEWLKSVDIFVASHHGRESGFCEEVFNICSPKLVIISDKSSSESSCADKYYSLAQGLYVNDPLGKSNMRYVLTTRRDGAILVDIDTEGRYSISTTI